jgi:NAD(P)-dependent dehydrogenase (short-subunit alcohol dehydrogenase family)
MSGLGFSSTTDEVLAGIDLTGRLAVVTGASTGLGEETARSLASAGVDVVMAVRDVAKGEAARRRILDSIDGSPSIDVRNLDLGSLASVRAFAAQFLTDHDRLDLLINNAGVMATPHGTTSDGFELQFGTNHLGHFLLSTLVAPALVASGQARVISLSSRGHAFSDADLDDPNFEHTTYDPFVAYGRSKTANALFAVAFDRRFADRGVHAYSVHPGGIHTELGRYMTRDVRARLMSQIAAGGRTIVWKTIPQGAATSVWAATAPELDAHGGAYLEDCHVATISDDEAAEDGVRAYALDPSRADALWALSEGLVAG